MQKTSPFQRYAEEVRQRARTHLAVTSLVTYAGLNYLLSPLFEESVRFLAVLVPATFGWGFGKRGGVLGALLAGLATWALKFLLEGFGPNFIASSALLGLLVLLAVGVAVGALFELRDELTAELKQRAKAERALAASLVTGDKLLEISQILNSDLEVETTLRNVVRLATELVGAQAGAIGLVDPEGTTISYPYLYNLPAHLTNASPRNSGLAWQIVDSQKCLLIADYTEHQHALSSWARSGVRSFIGVPIMAQGDCLGALALFHFDPSVQFSTEDLGALQVIGLQAGVAIQNARLFERVRHLAITDSLTELFNRRHFDECLHIEFSRALRYGRRLGLLVLDLDHFKTVNDEFGHQVGDAALVAVANELRDLTRHSDIVARYGGDEFIVLMPETSLDDSIAVAQRIQAAIADGAFTTGSEVVPLSASVGVVALPRIEAETPDDFIRLADKALYEAKARGRDLVYSL